ncbi:cytokine-induced anti-apoptosis inhibitor 1, Fe-S biogenesis-domain-containing protein [Mycotypha africana]|uniref:cytokine-induced anti-apoptosis inhibitor 1, Fe-S biogenesis-domain-containing protein n=1 Tax=Mycotypha africana TaxID=64632 RepID=UPI0023003B5B|nr:cytokine-induced anti-apoptosis inhibitor 1, Fe-S biogenesis-domain-containing protein [Mycotypha africana]KAI8967966.1 cytokine-induced anti-apoptosis inhibitor 1, Fe-S biogenesis-domain-containing protein [Mycotypha africana]
MQALNSERILFTGPMTIDQQAFIKVKAETETKVGPFGQVLFEIIERVANAPHPNDSLDRIYSNLFIPTISIHTPTIFARYLAALKNGGRLILKEAILLEDLSNTVSPISRKATDLISLLKLAGFVDIIVQDITPISKQELYAFSRLSGKFGMVKIHAKKPEYNVGQKVTLNFNKKRNNTSHNRVSKRKVWLINTNDDDQIELEDDEQLLDEEDKIKPSKESLARPNDCELTGGKRKACKNCTCGRTEDDDEEETGKVVILDLMQIDEKEPEIIEVDPTPKENTGCGNCSLGDAFRCSTCPYIGMPAFNEGEKIRLGGMFGSDDIDAF